LSLKNELSIKLKQVEKDLQLEKEKSLCLEQKISFLSETQESNKENMNFSNLKSHLT
jgi:hypothetical protein